MFSLKKRISVEDMSNVFRYPKGICIEQGVLLGLEPLLKQMNGGEIGFISNTAKSF